MIVAHYHQIYVEIRIAMQQTISECFQGTSYTCGLKLPHATLQNKELYVCLHVGSFPDHWPLLWHVRPLFPESVYGWLQL